MYLAKCFIIVCAVIVFLPFIASAQFTNGQAASGVIGQKSFTLSGQNNVDSLGLNSPNAVAVNPISGVVYVADTYNNRVLRYPNAASYVAGTGAVGVLGQPDFYSSNDACAQSGMSAPEGATVDKSGNLYVADVNNSRVLKFTNADSKANGANADAVLGQADFTSKIPATTQSGMIYPDGVAADGLGNLYVADGHNNRVLKFTNAASKANGANADAVLGQTDFSSGTAAFTQSRMGNPTSVAVDGLGNLYVVDNSYSRILKFTNAASKTNGANADAVFGQANFTSANTDCTQSTMDNPNGVAVDGLGNLYVADQGNSRVLIFTKAASKANGANADAVLGQTDFTSGAGGTTQIYLRHPSCVATNNSAGKLYVADNGNNRVLVFSASSSITSVENISQGVIPNSYSLNQNYPNPYNPLTTIEYGLPARSTIRLVIYNVLGQVVKELINSEQQAGVQTVVWNANVSSGIYFYRLEATSLDSPSKRFVETKKMLLLK
jgi:sugar lactone lactonase YvrE